MQKLPPQDSCKEHAVSEPHLPCTIIFGALWAGIPLLSPDIMLEYMMVREAEHVLYCWLSERGRLSRAVLVCRDLQGS